MILPRVRKLFGLLALLVTCVTARAQWTNETYQLKAGWNAIWLSQDVSHLPMAALLPAEVEEVWRWNAVPDGAFVTNPYAPPGEAGAQWSVWRRTDIPGSTMAEMTPNYAYLVRVNAGTPTFNWSLQGKPVAPFYNWNGTTANLIGFPTQTSPAPLLDVFYGYDAVLGGDSSTLYYDGGELSALAPKNPRPVVDLSTFQVKRFQAYWISSPGSTLSQSFTEYYGPVRVTVSERDGLVYGSEGVDVAVRLKNMTAGSTSVRDITVTLANVASATPPPGQPAEQVGGVPLKVRGALDLSTGLYAYTDLNANTTNRVMRTLAPGEEVEVIVTVNRSAMSAVPGRLYRGILSITDSAGLTRILLPVRAETPERSGLWVGAAVLGDVDFVQGTGKTSQAAPALFPLRLILHSDQSGLVRVLQQASVGKRGEVEVVTDHEEAFSATDRVDGRVASAHFPLGEPISAAGQLGLSGTVTFTVTLPFNSDSNPFVHRYHPDHDNLNDRYAALPAGRESNTILRSVTLSFAGSNPAGFDPSWGASRLGGTYTETVTGLRSVPLITSGSFVIQRQSSTPTFHNHP